MGYGAIARAVAEKEGRTSLILNDEQIKALCEGDAPLVTPYDPALINPASIDLRLGNLIRRPRRWWGEVYTPERLSVARFQLETEGHDVGNRWSLGPDDLWEDAREFSTYYLLPGEFVLCHSLEFVRIPRDVTALLYSKSSTGRRGLEHLHAGLGDPGFGLATPEGAQWTFEFQNVAPWPIKLEAGQRVMQMQLVRMAAPPLNDYTVTGRYNTQSGPTPAREAR